MSNELIKASVTSLRSTQLFLSVTRILARSIKKRHGDATSRELGLSLRRPGFASHNTLH